MIDTFEHQIWISEIEYLLANKAGKRSTVAKDRFKGF